MKSYRDIAKKDESILRVFDRTFREHLACFDMDTFIKTGGIIHYKTKINALSEACQYSIDAAVDMLSTKPADENLLAVRYGMNPSLLEVALSGLRVIDPPVQGVKQKPAQKPRPAPAELSAPQLASLRAKLRAMRANDERPLGPVFGKCKVPRCTVCWSAFEQLSITACTHKGNKCTEEGWYPHASQPMWAKVLLPCHKHQTIPELKKRGSGYASISVPDVETPGTSFELQQVQFPPLPVVKTPVTDLEQTSPTVPPPSSDEDSLVVEMLSDSSSTLTSYSSRSSWALDVEAELKRPSLGAKRKDPYPKRKSDVRKAGRLGKKIPKVSEHPPRR